MTCAEAIRTRRSIRRFQAAPVPRELVEQAVELAAWAPSASNRQDWLFTAVTAGSVKHAMAEAVRARWAAILGQHENSGVFAEMRQYTASFGDLEDAPVVIAIAARAPGALQRQMAGKAAHTVAGSFASGAMAAHALMLAAHSLGLGTLCLTGALVAEDELKNILGLGAREELVCLVKMGWPAETPAAPARKPLESILRWHD